MWWSVWVLNTFIVIQATYKKTGIGCQGRHFLLGECTFLSLGMKGFIDRVRRRENNLWCVCLCVCARVCACACVCACVCVRVFGIVTRPTRHTCKLNWKINSRFTIGWGWTPSHKQTRPPQGGSQNEDTLWRQHCWRDHVSAPNVESFPRGRNICVEDTNFVSWTQRMFLKIVRNISCVRATMLPRLARTGNIAGHNAAATMCSRFAGA